ncbi:MAG: hypothetical protein Q7J98_05150, partial [Kiritimatiellia bacterium]|nr:hypothetical protein [Kiritimatiellia bacterium]
DASGNVTGIKLIATSYEIQMDEGSKPLEAMDGQKVRINCTLSHEGGKRVLTVKNIEPSAGGGAAAVPTVVTPAAAPETEKPAEAPAKE